MKLFVAFVAFVAVAAAGPFKPADHIEEELEAIIAAIQHPSTDPATAALLEQQLQEIISAILPPVIGNPVIIDESIFESIHNPEQPIPSPLPIIYPTPIVNPIPSPTSPLVQIIVNVKNAADVGVASAIEPTPVQFVEESYDNNPIEPTPIQIVDSVPAPAEPILIAEPIVPIPVINIPGQLN